MDGCINGGFNIRRVDNDEQSILNDFANNINILYNGEEKNQNQIINELYYKDFDKNKTQKFIQTEKPKKIHVIPDEPKPIEPGQVDPESFFGNSLKGLY